MTAPFRTYPEVRTVTTAMPLLAQARLRAMMQDGGTPPSERNAFIEAVVLGMAIDPETATVDLERLEVTRPI